MEDEPDVVATKACTFVLRQGTEIGAGEDDTTSTGCVEAGEQCCLDRRGLAGLDVSAETMAADLDDNWEVLAEAVQSVTDAMGVAVVIEARHMCMMMRGVEKQNSSMMTSVMLGSFRESFNTRQEFLQLIGRDS